MRIKKVVRRIVNAFKEKPDYIEYLKNRGVIIGENVDILDSLIDETYSFLISIGDNVTITGAKVLCHDASTKKFLGYTKIGKVEIGDNVFIGKNAVILPNSFIGERTIIGAGAVVAGQIPPNSVVVGNPCKIICTFDEYINKHKLRMNDSNTIHKGFNELSEVEMNSIRDRIDGMWYAP